MQQEIEALEDNDTWTLEPLPARNVLWVVSGFAASNIIPMGVLNASSLALLYLVIISRQGLITLRLLLSWPK